MLKVIFLSVLLYVVCLSTIVDGRNLKRSVQKVSGLQKVQNNIRSLLSNNIGREITVHGKTYVIDGVLGIVPPGVSAHQYSQYWNDVKFMRSAFLQLQFDVRKVTDVDTVTPTPTTETYVYKTADKVGKGGNGVVYRAYKYTALGVKDTSKEYVIKEVDSLVDAKKECDEYQAAPRNAYIVECFGSAELTSKGYVVLENGGPDIDKFIAKGPSSETDRKTIIKGLLTGLKTLNDAGKVHRDLKAGNICFQNSQVKLIDFGWLKDFNTFTLTDVDTLENEWEHKTPFYAWPALEALFEMKTTDQVSDLTKTDYLKRIKSIIYLVDMGGAFATHLELVTGEITGSDLSSNGGDLYTYYTAVKSAKIDPLSTNEKAVLAALQDTSKTYDNILAMTWFA